MKAECEAKIYALLMNDDLAAQVIEVIHEDEAACRAALVQRQKEGLRKAKERGVRLGRPPVKRPKQFNRICNMYNDGKISCRAASKMLGVAPGTFKHWTMAEQDKNTKSIGNENENCGC